MTRKQQLNTLRRARRHLQRTKVGYREYAETGKGSEWKKAEEALDALEKYLSPPRIPDLGPVVAGGKSILDHELTHPTSGIPLYPAYDDGWQVGRQVIAPEDLVVTRQSSAQGGDAFYATGASKIRYWFGHIDKAPATGKKFRKGETMCRISDDHRVPHVHVGINVENLIGIGRELAHDKFYRPGRTPRVGFQLERLLNG